MTATPPDDTTATTGTGLVCRGLTKSFPGVRALDGVDLDVAYGHVEVVLGENGAGKSTLVKLLSGVYEPDTGTMTLDGRPYQPAGPRESMAAGIAMIHQEMNLIPGLSVAENVFLGRQPRHLGVIDYAEMHRAARAVLDRVGLAADVTTPVGSLSVAAQQQVEIAKALSLDARLLILDEPTASLGAEESTRLFEIIDDLRASGVGFVYITHRLKEVARVGDGIVVLRDGRRVTSFDHANIGVDRMVEAMVGRTVDQLYPTPPEPEPDELLRVEGLGRDGAFTDVSFSLRRGEVLGVAGLVGAGRTEVARALFGAEPADTGRVFLDGREIRLDSPIDAMRVGIVLVPEDRKAAGLVLGMSLQDNITLPSLRDLGERGLVRPSRLRQLAGSLTRRLDIRGQLAQTAGTLSGGNQQKAVIAKWMPRQPRLVIFDEPTRGIDVGAKAAIYELIAELAGAGVGVIVISSELLEVLGLARRVLVLSHGRQTGLLERDEATEERVMALAVSG